MSVVMAKTEWNAKAELAVDLNPCTAITSTPRRSCKLSGVSDNVDCTGAAWFLIETPFTNISQRFAHAYSNGNVAVKFVEATIVKLLAVTVLARKVMGVIVSHVAKPEPNAKLPGPQALQG